MAKVTLEIQDNHGWAIYTGPNGKIMLWADYAKYSSIMDVLNKIVEADSRIEFFRNITLADETIKKEKNG